MIQQVFANIPTYMVWDDHEIRDGFGSLACDSPTLALRFPRGQKMFARSDAYFQDCRDVYWHFQGCHNPLKGETAEPSLPNYIVDPPNGGPRRAMRRCLRPRAAARQRSAWRRRWLRHWLRRRSTHHRASSRMLPNRRWNITWE